MRKVVWRQESAARRGQRRRGLALPPAWRTAPARAPANGEALTALGIEEVLQNQVLGRGRQRGLRYLRPNAGGQEGGMEFLPKRMAVWLVPDEQADLVVATITETNATDNYGDGKIFVCPLEPETPAS